MQSLYSVLINKGFEIVRENTALRVHKHCRMATPLAGLSDFRLCSNFSSKVEDTAYRTAVRCFGELQISSCSSICHAVTIKRYVEICTLQTSGPPMLPEEWK
jgi:hypothetical protein